MWMLCLHRFLHISVRSWKDGILHVTCRLWAIAKIVMLRAQECQQNLAASVFQTTLGLTFLRRRRQRRPQWRRRLGQRRWWRRRRRQWRQRRQRRRWLRRRQRRHYGLHRTEERRHDYELFGLVTKPWISNECYHMHVFSRTGLRPDSRPSAGHFFFNTKL